MDRSRLKQVLAAFANANLLPSNDLADPFRIGSTNALTLDFEGHKDWANIEDG